MEGSTDLNNLAALLHSVPEDQQINEKLYSAYVDCTLKQTAIFLHQDAAPLSTMELVGSLSVVGGSPDLTKRYDKTFQTLNFKNAAFDMAD